MAFFKPIYKKMSKKWHPQAVSMGKPIEMDELCKQIAPTARPRSKPSAWCWGAV